MLPGGAPEFNELKAIVNGQETAIYACWGLGMFSLMVCLMCGHRHHVLRSQGNAQQKDPARVSRALRDHFVNKKACSCKPDDLDSSGIIKQLHKQLPNDSRLLNYPRTPIVSELEVEKYEKILMGTIVDGLLCSRCGLAQPAGSNIKSCCNTFPSIEVKISKGEIDIPFLEKPEEVRALYSHDTATPVFWTKDGGTSAQQSLVMTKDLKEEDFSEFSDISKPYESLSDKITSIFGLQNEEVLRVVGVLHLPPKDVMIKLAEGSRPFRARDDNYSVLLIKASDALLRIADQANSLTSVSQHLIFAKLGELDTGIYLGDGGQGISTSMPTRIFSRYSPKEHEHSNRVARVATILNEMFEAWKNFPELEEVLAYKDELISSYSGDGFSNRDILTFAKLIDKMLQHMMKVGGDFMPKVLLQRLVYVCSGDVESMSDDENEGEGGKRKNSTETDEVAQTGEASISGVEIRTAKSLERILMSWIHLLESVVVRQCHLVNKLRANGEIPRTSDTSEISTIRSCLGGGVVAELVHIMQRLRRLSPNTEQGNSVLVVQSRGEARIVLPGGNPIGVSGLRAAGRNSFQFLRDSFYALFPNSLRTLVESVWSVVTDPENEEGKDRRVVWNGPGLSSDSWLRKTTNSLVESVTDENDFLVASKTFMEHLMGSIYLLSSFTPRLPEMHDFWRKGSRTTIQIGWDYMCCRTYMFVSLVSKTKKEGFGSFPFYLSRLISIWLDEIAPKISTILLDNVKKKFLQIPNAADKWDEWKPAVEMVTYKLLKERIGCVPHDVNSPFLKRLRYDMPSLSNFSGPETKEMILRQELWVVPKMDDVLHRVVAEECLEQPPELNERSLRKLVVDMKESVSEHIDTLSSTELSIELRQYALCLINKICDLGVFAATRDVLASSGHHSAITSRQSYGRKQLLDDTDTQIDANVYLSHRIHVELLAIFFGLPVQVRHQNEVRVEWEECGPLSSKIKLTKETEPTVKQCLLESMQKLNYVDFLSETQMQAMICRVLQTSTIALGLRTGGGKTDVWAIPALLCSKGACIVAVPFRVLVEELVQSLQRRASAIFDGGAIRVEAFSVDKAKFTSSSVDQGFWDDSEVRIVVGTYDAFLQNTGLAFVTALRRRGLLNSLTIDEFHHCITSGSFRFILGDLHKLTRLGVPLTLASASVPCDVQDAFLRQICVDPSQVLVFREYPKYGGERIVDVVEVSEGNDMSKLVMSILEDHLIREERHFTSLVFAQTKAESNRFYTDFTETRLTMSKATSACKVDSDTSSKDISRMMKETDCEDRSCVIFTTSILAEGQNIQNVRLVVVAGGALGGVVQLDQMAGRAGRPGSMVKTSHVVILLAPDYTTRLHGNKADEVLEHFPKEYRAKASKAFGFSSQKHLVGLEGNKLCGGQMMERLLGTPEDRLSLACQRCFSENEHAYPSLRRKSVDPVGDVLSAWQNSSLPEKTVETEAPENAEEAATSKSKRRKMVPDEQMFGTTEPARFWVSIDQKAADSFWTRREASCKCFACGKDRTDEDHIQKPSLCPILRFGSGYEEAKRLKRKCCPYCLQLNHDYNADQYSNQLTKLKDDLSKAGSDTTFKAAKWDEIMRKIGNCIIVFGQCPWAIQAMRGNEKLCDRCWLYHTKGELKCIVGMNVVRNVLMTVWYDKTQRKALSEEEWVRGKEWVTWTDFMRWALYHRSDQDVPNVTRIACYLSAMVND